MDIMNKKKKKKFPLFRHFCNRFNNNNYYYLYDFLNACASTMRSVFRLMHSKHWQMWCDLTVYEFYIHKNPFS